MNEVWSHIYAVEYAEWIERVLMDRLGWCSEQMIYASWNVGVNRVIKAKGHLSGLKRATQVRCLKFSSAKVYKQAKN